MSTIHRFLTRRDRQHRPAKQSREETSHVLSRPLFRGFFTSEATPEEGQDHEKKVKSLQNRIKRIGITILEEEHINYALHSTQGDVEKAFSLLMLLEDSIEGIIRNYTPNTKLLGAENRQGVTCYLDALLFAMFARLDCFEAILYKSFNDEPRRKLAILLRFWVNLLRAGKLVTTDITKHLQDALADCGWKDAAKLRQQDASEAFTFITEKLELPLLTLKMDIYHTGKEDESGDHKFVNERLLEVAIPPEPTDGRTLTLEDCLEAYFNNMIEVKRYLGRRNTLSSTKSVDSLSKGFAAHIEAVEVDSNPTSSPVQSITTRPEKGSPWSSFAEFNEALGSPRSLNRRESIVRERFIPDSSDGNPADKDSSVSGSQQRKGVYRKEVMMPAWQFFSLIPWYTDNTPTNDAQVAAHFSSKRPILGMCLKRYSFLPNGKAVRLNTYIDIPTEIGLPHFIQDDNMNADAPIYGNFKLSLQALVCHRGTSVNSGHYIAIVRGTSPNAGPSGSSGSDHPTSEPSRYWMRFDDLATERVTLVDIDQALKTESPYLLFYQILPVDEDAAAANLQNNEPPAYESDVTLDLDASDVSRALLALSADQTDDSNAEEPASGRPSVEVTGPDNAGAQITSNPGTRHSVTFSGPTHPGSRQPRSVPSTSPRLVPTGGEGTRGPFPFTRHGSRATKSTSGSRAASQSSENRIGATISRFAGRLSKDKITGDGFSTEGEGDESAAEMDDAAPDDVNLGPAAFEGKEKGRRDRTKDRDHLKGKPKEKNRKLERECGVM